ncbi:MAG TPA: ABC transporter permease, partial [Polyangiaceae bacterium]|nr:ABC transporter permease [Polyangiaceae bacterium]
MLEAIWRDLKHGARLLVENPGFSFVAVVSIAIGVGVNAAMFSMADALMFRPLPVPRASELVAVSATTPQEGAGVLRNRSLSYRDYVDLRDRAGSFAGLVAYQLLVTSFANPGTEPAQSRLGLGVSGNFFNALGLQPALGRFFRPDEDRVGGRDAVVVLAHNTWTEQFGADPRILERRIGLDGEQFSVVGVAPASFAGMSPVLHPAFYVPLAITPVLAGSLPGSLEHRDVRTLEVKGRLSPGVSLAQAQHEVDIIARDLEHAYPDTNRSYGLLVRTDFKARLEDSGPGAPAAFMVMTLSFVVLLVACANVAGLLTSRAPARTREIALRLAIGGGRLRVIRQLVTETVLMSAGGGALGLAIAYGVIRLFDRFEVPSDLGTRVTFQLDQRVLVVGLVLAAASALFSSLVPAWRATQVTDLSRTLRNTTAAGSRSTRLWGRNGLVAGQVALSLVLLTVSVFLYRAFQAELGQGPGFRTERMALMNLEPRLARYDAARSEALYTALKERARAIHGVTSVGLTSAVPMSQDYKDTAVIVPEGYQFPRGMDSATVQAARIDEGYLRTMGIPIISGRVFQSADSLRTPHEVVVNRTLAARYWPGQNPIGKRVRVGGPDAPWSEIVGVASDSKYSWIAEAPTPFVYLPRSQDPGLRSTLVVAIDGHSAALAAPLRQIVRELDPNLPIASIRTMEEFYEGSAVKGIVSLVRIVSGMGVVGMGLGMVGLYGLVAYVAARRTREIGIRMAVGADPASILRMVLRHGLMLAIGGAVVGIVVSAAASDFLRAT